MIDLRQKDRDAICRFAADHFEPATEIWAYGSRVKGTNHDTSDLDLVVRFPVGSNLSDNLDRLSQFIETLRESSIPIIVQVLAWDSIPDYFRSNILKCYQVLWTKEKSS